MRYYVFKKKGIKKMKIKNFFICFFQTLFFLFAIVLTINVTAAPTFPSGNPVSGIHANNTISLSSDHGFAYIGNYGNNTISIVDTTTNNVIGMVNDPYNTFNGIYYIVFSPNGNKAYVASYAGPISIIDTATHTVIGTINNPGFVDIYSMAITPDGSKLYIINYTNIIIIDTANDTILKTITGFSGIYFMVITPDGKTGYIADYSNSSVDILDIATDTITGQIPVAFSGPFSIAITPDGTKLFIGNYNNNTISVVNIPANTLAQTITNPNFNNIYWIEITPDGKTAYVNNFDNNVFAINTTTYTVTDIPNAHFSNIYYSAVTSDGKSVYVASYGEGTTSNLAVSIIDTATNIVTGNVTDTNSTFNYVYPLAISPLIQAPRSATGCRTQNIFLTQTDFINRITWTPPFAGTTPIGYYIYRNAQLTDLAGIVSASGLLQFLDHNRDPNVVSTYYIVSVDKNNNISAPEVIQVTQIC